MIYHHHIFILQVLSIRCTHHLSIDEINKFFTSGTNKTLHVRCHFTPTDRKVSNFLLRRNWMTLPSHQIMDMIRIF